MAPFEDEIKDDEAAAKTTTREYIASQPELKKLLADLYQDYDQKEEKEKSDEGEWVHLLANR